MISILLMSGCSPAATAPVAIQHRGAAARELPPLPCGASTIEELHPYGRDRVGECEVVHEGDYVTLLENGTPIMRAGEAKPTVVLDARIPGPAGIRVGDTVDVIRARSPGRGVLDCHRFEDFLQCELRATAESPGCGDPAYADTIHLRFAPPAAIAIDADVSGDAAWRAIADQPATAVLLDMPC